MPDEAGTRRSSEERQREPDSPKALQHRAIAMLSRREHTRAELSRKLSAYAASEEALAQLLDRLVERKLLSDERFAEARSRGLSLKYGAARVKSDLRARGVADDVIARHLETVAEGEVDRAREIVQRKYRGEVDSRKEYARRARFLQSRGFSFEVIRSVLAASSGDDD